MTEREANERGYRLVRGAYRGTTDDRIDRWYWDNERSSTIDRRGAGYRTRREALDTLADRLLDE